MMCLVRDGVGFKTALRFLKCFILQLHPPASAGKKEGENPPSPASSSRGWSTVPAWGLGCLIQGDLVLVVTGEE